MAGSPNGVYHWIGWLNVGDSVQLTGNRQTGSPSESKPPNNTWYEIKWGGGTAWINGDSITSVGSGSGGWGQAGSTNPIGMMGWTSGWEPVGGGAAGTILSQRAGLQTAGSGGRFDYGGAGGGSSSVNRSGTNKALRPKQKLSRRMLSGRR